MTDVDVDRIRRFVGKDNGLVSVATTRQDGGVQASVVNAGVLANPIDGSPAVALVAQGRARKVTNLRHRPLATVVARNGWEWAAVEGATTIIGPDDLPPGFDAAQVPQLLRDVFVAAGGSHDDWAEYDRVMARERRAAVFIAATRVYSNG